MASGIANLVALINKMPSLPLSMGGRPNADAKEEEEELEEDTKRWRFTWIKFTWNAWNYLHFWRLRYAAVIINNIVVVIIIFVVVAAGVRLNRLVFIPPSRAWPLFIFVVGSFFFGKPKSLQQVLLSSSQLVLPMLLLLLGAVLASTYLDMELPPTRNQFWIERILTSQSMEIFVGFTWLQQGTVVGRGIKNINLKKKINKNITKILN